MFKEKNINTIIDNINTDKLEFSRYKYIDNNPVEDGEISIDSNIIEELEWVKTYLSDFYIMFKLIDERNINELIDSDDSDDDIISKDLLFSSRMESIKPIKKAFVYYAVNNFKRNKDSIYNIKVILDYYINMRYYNQVYNEIDRSGYTVIGNRYKVITTTSSTKRVGQIYIETISTLITQTNSVQEQFLLSHEKDGDKYILKSIITLTEFDSVLRDILVPVGWELDYIKISSAVSDLLFDVNYETNNVTRIGNGFNFDDVEIYINDLSINNFKNNINSQIEREFIIS